MKPNAETGRAGCRQLGVEPYGGVLWHTWLDRDLSLAGRVAVSRDGGVETHLVDFARPLLRIPSLAIHLHRDVNRSGLKLNAQKHLSPLWALENTETSFRALLLEELGTIDPKLANLSEEDLLSWDLGCYERVPSTLSGAQDEFIHAPRLDNLASCHAALHALLGSAEGGEDAAHTRGVLLFDHEEVGSRSAQGAASTLVRTLLMRITAAFDERTEALPRALARSELVSADMAHALHPNYVDRHEPDHQPVLGGGPVVKTNVNQSYTTNAESAARFMAMCREVEVPIQQFVTRSDLGCGSTIGPVTAAQLGVRAIDVGSPMLSMHSAREMAAAADVAPMVRALTRFFVG